MSKFLLLFLICFIKSLVVLSTKTCNEKCISKWEEEAECLRPIKESLTLECTSSDFVYFVRKFDNKNITSFLSFFDDNSNYSYIEGSYNKLVINKLRTIDSGSSSFQAIELTSDTNKRYCSFSIYVYDLKQKEGTLTFGPSLYKIESEEKIDIKIESYKQSLLNFTYKYEALPLDYLTVNGKRVEEANACKNKTNDWLNCFEKELLQNF